jgi:hypothetical protein
MIGPSQVIETEVDAGASGPDDLQKRLGQLHGSAWQTGKVWEIG